MGYEVRKVNAAEFPEFVACMGAGFFHPIADGYAEFILGQVDLERTRAVFDGGQVVGTLRSFATTLTVPGHREVRAAALTNVTVAPSHRRRGLLTEMISADLRDTRERGEPVGILVAAEFPIYGRYGYGLAVEAAKYTIDTGRVRWLDSGVGTIERVDLATLRREAPPLYDRFRLSQPGSIERTSHWWDRVLRQVEVPGADEPAAVHSALYRSPTGELEGYVRYQGKQIWDDMVPKGLLTIDELVTTSAAAYRRSWQYCCDIDLMATVEASDRPVEETLPLLVEDGRAVRQSARFDFVWLRVLDVCAALAERRYAMAGSIVIEVSDPIGFATGRYLLEGSWKGSACTRSVDEPDLVMPVESLGSLYLGGVGWRRLAAAGRVEERSPGALAKADLMFGTYPVPWCSTWF